MSCSLAFVGIKKKFSSIENELQISVSDFVRYHLELPWYYSLYGKNKVFITTVDQKDQCLLPNSSVDVTLVNETDLSKCAVDVVIHWRSWQQWAFDSLPNSLHLLQTQDHSFSNEWINNVTKAIREKALSHIIAFETWHANNTHLEIQSIEKNFDRSSILTKLHLGVDTTIYKPKEKDPYKLLWASDPGRGLQKCIEVFSILYRLDKRYKLHVLCPDYARNPFSGINHPGIVTHNNIRNSPELWDMFNTSTYIPYTSTFMEPSSRVHRQGQAAGCCVIYPENMGTPSELIVHCVNGVIMNECSKPVDWANMILSLNGDNSKSIGKSSRMFALTEDWSVQAVRFNNVCSELLNK